MAAVLSNSFTEKLDSLLIMLNCSASYSILPYVIFHQYLRGIFVILIGVLNIAYLAYKYGKNTELSDNKLFFIYFILNLWNIFAGLYSGTGFLSSIAYLFMNSTFFLILYNNYLNYRLLYSQKKSLWLIVRGYVWLIVLCLISVTLTFTIIKLGINPYGNNISTKYDLFEDNITNLGHEYYAPLLTGVLLAGNILSVRIPFFSEAGIICGIYHEPHVLTFMVFPCIFIMWAFAKSNIQKFLIFFSAIFVMLLAASTTNLLVCVACICVALFYSEKGRVLLFPLLGGLVLLVFIIGLENTELFFMVDKLEDGGGSRSYTTEALKFAFIPKSIVGSNILNTSFIQDLGAARRDAGVFSVVLNLLFLIGCYIKLFPLLLSKRFNCMIGIGILYFLLHSMKTNMTTYTSSILMLSLFLISYTIYTPSLKKQVGKYAYSKEGSVQ